ncbi:MAG: membrane protein insertase YidC [Proteobacteria bacterium]|nr:membrane protein insertase YidC [Pseudomonadota bacterium]
MHQNNKNTLLAISLSVVILIGWTWLYEKPRIEKKELAKQQKIQETKKAEITTQSSAQPKIQETILATKSREESLAESKNLRLKIASDSLHGSISLKGARFDDLTLAKYFETQEKKKEVTLFAPAESKERYFADFGWISSNRGLELPNPDTIWKSDSEKLTPENPVTLSWRNKQNVAFFIKLTLDENYMFSVTQSIKNNSKDEITVASYGRINRALSDIGQSNYILHEGMIGVFEGILKELSYKKMLKEKKFEFQDSGENGSWLGVTDKYWLSALIPDKKVSYSAKFSENVSNKRTFFDSEFVGQEYKIAAGEELDFNHHLFAGAKKVKLLDQYAKDFELKLFDRAVDFGWFYFLTKPFFFIIDFLNKFLGNFGLAILAMTVLVKLALFPMANKSYAAIAKIKKLQPKIEALRERHKGDKLAIHREMMDLYKKEKVNPASGCLPVLIQIPVFFALYKVLFVTLDMRHAPFYGWIHDLSAPDPMSIFNLFGFLPFEVSGFFAIGIWPILMGITMVIQQKLSPATSDPTQAMILKWMPFVLTFVLAAFPAGLVIYWTWSNALSILQQWVITKKVAK